ncbi:hypothetical protein D3OALGA1CA_4144 [Olavius algarvensis associated proteobacterium Delta 3]|nr:hypothetical protein D3OALGB2SA_826 [Olavius algarvensis associated proteobacterium Delta 3]CAB5146091.1 hypothetical protein D3OALGA1CA_4144 [Olavius algarvensis associated proteobacterium Delta 3]
MSRFQSFIKIGMIPPNKGEIITTNAEELAVVLKPFLSSSGTILPYPQTNTLIIKAKKSIVRKLIKVVKGSEDLRVCQNFHETSEN